MKKKQHYSYFISSEKCHLPFTLDSTALKKWKK